MKTGDRCVNCGSTAQTEKIKEIRQDGMLVEFFECSCGCKFKKIYLLQKQENLISIKKEG
jgi:hypothetical protein